MMIHKSNSLIVLAALLLCACTRHETGMETDGMEIRLTSQLGGIGNALTRATVNDTYTALTAQVMKTHVQGNYLTNTEGSYAGAMTFAPGTYAVFDEAQYYPGDETQAVYLCGLHPATGWEAATGTPSTALRNLDGCTDVMVAKEVTSTRAQASAGTYPTLAFEHVLTHLVVTARSEDSDAADSWGEITRLELKAKGNASSNQVSIQLSDGTPTYYTGVDAPAIGMYRATGSGADAATYTYTDEAFEQRAIPEGSAYVPLAYSLVPPVTATVDADAWVLKVYTVKRPAGYEVPVRLKNAGSTMGKRYVVALTFKVVDIKSQATVAPWTAGETIEEDVVL